MKIKPLEWVGNGAYARGIFGGYHIWADNVEQLCMFSPNAGGIYGIASKPTVEEAKRFCNEHAAKLLSDWLEPGASEPEPNPQSPPEAPTITGDLVQWGDDEEGRPCITIVTTREEIQRAGNWLYKPVTVRGVEQ